MYQNINYETFKLPHLQQYQSNITFIPKYPEYINSQKSQLQVGLELPNFSMMQKKQQQLTRKNTPPKKYLDEFPAYYLDLLPIPPYLQEKEPHNYLILQGKGERPKKIEMNQLPSLRQLKETPKSKVSSKTTLKPKNKPIIKSLDLQSLGQNYQQKETDKQINKQSLQTEQKMNQQKKPSSLQLQRLIKRVYHIKIWLSFYKLLQETLTAKSDIILKQQREEFAQNLKGALRQLSDWTDASLDDLLLEIINLKDPLYIKVGEEKQNQQKKKNIENLLVLCMKKLQSVNIAEFFTKQLSLILNNLIQPYQFPPVQYYFKFEIVRLKTTSSGSLGQIEKNQQRMILMLFLIIRQILFAQILRAWQFHPNQTDNDKQLILIQANSIILVSVVHEIVIKWIERNVPKKRGLDLDLLHHQFQFLEKPLTQDKEKMEKQGKIYQDNELIEGILGSNQIMKYLQNSKGEFEKWVIQFEKDMIDFCDKIYDHLTKEFVDQPRQRDRICKMMSIHYLASLIRKH
ncbi:unnamed protein product [Paramecium octaurelia]|uniref:Uncharacterized protein n=1 Tax=Paramecium octaurelia TaxID=43137 RepID=A0A8S1X0W4_PAROT|nr:unnamed protein product [Paramecium octaurelia]CAD8195783.1 unnamed protein product [Paramecium octaurelia]